MKKSPDFPRQTLSAASRSNARELSASRLDRREFGAARLNRRDFNLYAAAGLALVGGGLWSSQAFGGQAAPWSRLVSATALLQGANPRLGVLDLDLPQVWEDGSAVPLTVALPADGPDVEAVYLFATRNPVNEELAVLRPSAAAKPFRVHTRIRLDQTQDVVALALTRSGEWLAAARNVRVTVSGCMTGAAESLGENHMRILARIPEQVARGQSVELQTNVQHPMETGLRANSQGAIMPRRIIESFQLLQDDDVLFEARLYPSIATNPYLRFNLVPERSGQLRVVWVEDTGQSAEQTLPVTVS